MNSDISNPHNVYEKAETFWSRCSQDENGMLGGLADLHEPDVALSTTFLTNLKKRGIVENFDNCLDCGAGIGRVTKHVLMPLFKTVDMVDIIDELIAKSSEYIGTDDGIGEKYVEGLQTFQPDERKYDVIWIQWVSGHLTDSDLRDFLKRCINGLAPSGVIIIKDNVANGKDALFDDEDCSWTRPQDLLDQITSDAGLQLVTKSLQTGFPRDIYPVKIMAFKPVHPVEEDD